MSADNIIAILQTKDGFRVTHAQAIDNLYWWPKKCCKTPNIDQDEFDGNEFCTWCGSIIDYEKKDELCPSIVYCYFKDSKVYKTADDAYEKACDIYDEIMEDDFCPIVEYGIQWIQDLKDKDFNTFK